MDLTQDQKPIVQTGYHIVRDAMRRDIVAGRFGEDGRMRMRDLVARYGMSSAPIREALGQLEAEGLLSMHANRGAQARRIDADFVAEFYEVRRELESMLVARAVLRIDDSDINDLRGIQAQFEAACKVGEVEPIMRLNAEFHHRIYVVSPNGEAIRLMRQHEATMSALRGTRGFGVERLGDICKEHEMLIEACARRDVESARAVARLHITHSMINLVGRLD